MHALINEGRYVSYMYTVSMQDMDSIYIMHVVIYMYIYINIYSMHVMYIYIYIYIYIANTRPYQ
jgi:hypothetical protein